jgi:hypothetical protein
LVQDLAETAERPTMPEFADRGGPDTISPFLRTLTLPDPVERRSLTLFREKVVKIGAKVIAHARSAIFQMAEVAVPRGLFVRILEMIDGLRPRPLARCCHRSDHSMLTEDVRPHSRSGSAYLCGPRFFRIQVRNVEFQRCGQPRWAYAKEGLVWSATWGSA